MTGTLFLLVCRHLLDLQVIDTITMQVSGYKDPGHDLGQGPVGNAKALDSSPFVLYIPDYHEAYLECALTT